MASKYRRSACNRRQLTCRGASWGWKSVAAAQLLATEPGRRSVGFRCRRANNRTAGLLHFKRGRHGAPRQGHCFVFGVRGPTPKPRSQQCTLGSSSPWSADAMHDLLDQGSAVGLEATGACPRRTKASADAPGTTADCGAFSPPCPSVNTGHLRSLGVTLGGV